MTAQVLVVDHNRGAREALQTVLEEQGYRVAAVANGRQALERIATTRPDLVVTEPAMPAMTGPELQALVRELGIGVPVVFLTARLFPGTVVESCRPDACLDKFDVGGVLRTVARLTAA